MNKKLKTICFVTQEYPPETNWGGIASYYFCVANELNKRGFKIIVISRSLTSNNYNYCENGIEIFRVKPFLQFQDLRFLWRISNIWDGYQIAICFKLLSLVKKYDIDLIETPSLHGEVSLFKLIHKKVPLIVRFHSVKKIQSELLNIKINFQYKVSNFFESLCIKLADSYSAVSNFAFTENLKAYPFLSDVFIYGNPINLNEVEFILNAKEENICNNHYVLYVGRLEYLKGILDLISALPMVFNRVSTLNFIFVGKDGIGPSKFNSMIKYIYSYLPSKYHANVQFKGHLEKNILYQLMKNAEAVIFPSLIETFGYVVLESMALGTPIISTTSGGPQEIIENNVDGILIPLNNPDEIANSIINLIENKQLSNYLVQNAKKKAVKYDSNNISNSIIHHYKIVLNEL